MSNMTLTQATSRIEPARDRSTGGLPAPALDTDPVDPDVMLRPPRPREATFTDRRFFSIMTLTGLLTAVVSSAVYPYSLRREGLEAARTNAFATPVYRGDTAIAVQFYRTGVSSYVRLQTEWQVDGG